MRWVMSPMSLKMFMVLLCAVYSLLCNPTCSDDLMVDAVDCLNTPATHDCIRKVYGDLMKVPYVYASSTNQCMHFPSIHPCTKKAM